MIKYRSILFVGLLGLITACSSQERGEFHGRTYEYSSWFDGDSSNDLEPYRKILSEKIEESEKSDIDTTNTEKYLDYLADLDGAGKGSQAELKLKDFIAKNPEETRAVFLLGVHYMRNKKKELANHFFKKLEKDSKFPWLSLLYNNLGMLSLQEQDREKAIGYFEKAINAQPSIAAPRVNLGSLLLQSKSYSEAQPLFQKALELDGNFEDAALGLGNCLEGQGKFDEAHRIYAAFAEDHPNSLVVLYNDATVLGKNLGKKEEASELMLRYIQRGGKEAAKAHEMIRGWR